MRDNFNANPSAEAALVARLKQGDDQAWSDLIQEYDTRLRAYLSQQLPDIETVEDVISAIMLAIVRAIGTFDGKVSLATFIFALANRKVSEFYQRRIQSLNLALEWPWQELAPRDSGSISLFAELPEMTQYVLILRYQVGLGIDEIAEILGRNYKATESLLSRARRQWEQIQAVHSSPASFSIQKPSSTQLFHSPIQMLVQQQRSCLALGLQHEAQLFAHSIQLLEGLFDNILPTPAEAKGLTNPRWPPLDLSA